MKQQIVPRGQSSYTRPQYIESAKQQNIYQSNDQYSNYPTQGTNSSKSHSRQSSQNATETYSIPTNAQEKIAELLRPGLRYHKRNKSEPLGTNLLSATLGTIKTQESEISDKPWQNEHSYQINSSTLKKEDIFQTRANSMKDAQTLKPNMKLDLTKITTKQDLNTSVGNKTKSTQALKNTYNQSKYINKENASFTSNISLESKPTPKNTTKPPISSKYSSLYSQTNEDLEQPKLHIDPTTFSKRAHHGTIDTPGFNAKQPYENNFSFPSGSIRDTREFHHLAAGMKEYEPIIDFEPSQIQSRVFTKGSDIFNDNSAKKNYTTNNSFSLNISEIQHIDKSPNKINLSGSVCIFDDNISFVNFMNPLTELQQTTPLAPQLSKIHEESQSIYENGKNDQSSINYSLPYQPSANEKERMYPGFDSIRMSRNVQEKKSSKDRLTTAEKIEKVERLEMLERQERLERLEKFERERLESEKLKKLERERIERENLEREKYERLNARHKESSKNILNLMLQGPAQSSHHAPDNNSKPKKAKSMIGKLKTQSKILHRKKKSFAEDLPGTMISYKEGSDGPVLLSDDSDVQISKAKAFKQEKLTKAYMNKTHSGTTGSQHFRSFSCPYGELNQMQNTLKPQDPKPQTGTLCYHKKKNSLQDNIKKSHGSNGDIYLETQPNPEIDRDTSFNSVQNSRSHHNLKDLYKQAVRLRDRKSYDHTQLCKSHLQRIASNPEELSQFVASFCAEDNERKELENFNQQTGIVQNRESIEPNWSDFQSNTTARHDNLLHSKPEADMEEERKEVVYSSKLPWSSEKLVDGSSSLRKFTGGYYPYEIWGLRGGADKKENIQTNTNGSSNTTTTTTTTTTAPRTTAAPKQTVDPELAKYKAAQAIEESRKKLEQKIKAEAEAKKKKQAEEKLKKQQEKEREEQEKLLKEQERKAQELAKLQKSLSPTNLTVISNSRPETLNYEDTSRIVISEVETRRKLENEYDQIEEFKNEIESEEEQNSDQDYYRAEAKQEYPQSSYQNRKDSEDDFYSRQSKGHRQISPEPEDPFQRYNYPSTTTSSKSPNQQNTIQSSVPVSNFEGTIRDKNPIVSSNEYSVQYGGIKKQLPKAQEYIPELQEPAGYSNKLPKQLEAKMISQEPEQSIQRNIYSSSNTQEQYPKNDFTSQEPRSIYKNVAVNQSSQANTSKRPPINREKEQEKAILQMEINAEMKKYQQSKEKQKKEQEEASLRMKQLVLSKIRNPTKEPEAPQQSLPTQHTKASNELPPKVQQSQWEAPKYTQPQYTQPQYPQTQYTQPQHIQPQYNMPSDSEYQDTNYKNTFQLNRNPSNKDNSARYAPEEEQYSPDNSARYVPQDHNEEEQDYQAAEEDEVEEPTTAKRQDVDNYESADQQDEPSYPYDNRINFISNLENKISPQETFGHKIPDYTSDENNYDYSSTETPNIQRNQRPKQYESLEAIREVDSYEGSPNILMHHHNSDSQYREGSSSLRTAVQDSKNSQRPPTYQYQTPSDKTYSDRSEKREEVVFKGSFGPEDPKPNSKDQQEEEYEFQTTRYHQEAEENDFLQKPYRVQESQPEYNPFLKKNKTEQNYASNSSKEMNKNFYSANFAPNESEPEEAQQETYTGRQEAEDEYQEDDFDLEEEMLNPVDEGERSPIGKSDPYRKQPANKWAHQNDSDEQERSPEPEKEVVKQQNTSSRLSNNNINLSSYESQSRPRKTWQKPETNNFVAEQAQEKEIKRMVSQGALQKEDLVKEPQVLVFDNFEDEETKARKMKQYEKMKKKMSDLDEKRKDRGFGIKKPGSRGEMDANISGDDSPNEAVMPKIQQNQQPPKSNRPPLKEGPKKTIEETSEKITKSIPNLPRINQSPGMYQEEMKTNETTKSAKSQISSQNIFQQKGSETPTGQQKPKIIGLHKNSNIKKPSNSQMIKLAIKNVSLAGEPNKKEREEVLAKIAENQSENFIIAFKSISGRLEFKGLYTYEDSTNEVRRLHPPNMPSVLDPSIVQNYFKYDSGAKEFKLLSGNKNFSLAVDAVSLVPTIWKKPNLNDLY